MTHWASGKTWVKVSTGQNLGGCPDRDNYVDNFESTVSMDVDQVSSKIHVSNLNAFPLCFSSLSLSLLPCSLSASPPLRNSINLYTRRHWNI